MIITNVVAALIWEGNRFLACQRPAHKKRALLWEFVGGKVEEGESYQEALVRECKEELGVDARAGVGPVVKELKDAALSYAGADNALRYADVFNVSGSVHSYREFILVKMLESVPESKLAEYFAELSDEKLKEIFDDEEMLNTAEAFLQSSLNVSETSRNTLLYRLDKIEKATGLNIRAFPDAVSFRVLTILHKLLGK